MRHKTIHKLMERVYRMAVHRAPATMSYGPWRVDAVIDWSANTQIWHLWHYGTHLLTVYIGPDLGVKIWEGTVAERRGLSVSDQRGMNAFLETLGVLTPDTYVSRKGRTARYVC